MSVSEQWEALLRGEREEGITLMQESFLKKPTPSTLMTLGLGYLWTGQYDRACAHFQEWIIKYKVTMEAYSSLIGVAWWCLGDTNRGITSWKEGLRAQYIDMAGGMRSPLLLWCASVLSSDEKLREEAVRSLGKKAKDAKVRHWPGPLGQFVLKQIDESTVFERAREKLSQRIPPGQEWQVEFYKYLRELECGDIGTSKFDEALRALVDTSTSGWSDEDRFLQLVRNPEFYIARHEVSKRP